MALLEMAQLRAMLRPGERLIGIDPGSRTVGVALSDVRLALASPYGELRRGKMVGIARMVRGLAEREGAGGLVVGLPLTMDGALGPAAQAARDWTHALSTATGLPAAMWDERMTTEAVHESLIEQHDLGRRRRAAVVDRLAAAAILQAALDATGPHAGFA